MEEKAIFGAGCFWGVEATFRQIEGVIDASVGYSGGKAGDTSYREVCSGDTGHAEVVLVCFDNNIVSYEALLDVFWGCHDPTQLNRQGLDMGTQYRSAIFYMTLEQKEKSNISKMAIEASGVFSHPVVTKIEKADQFHLAEQYHQNYLAKNGLLNCHNR